MSKSAATEATSEIPPNGGIEINGGTLVRAAKICECNTPGLIANKIEEGDEYAFERGAAVAFGLIGMAEAITETDYIRKSHPKCPDCKGDLGGNFIGRLEDHKPGCSRFPL